MSDPSATMCQINPGGSFSGDEVKGPELPEKFTLKEGSKFGEIISTSRIEAGEVPQFYSDPKGTYGSLQKIKVVFKHPKFGEISTQVDPFHNLGLSIFQTKEALQIANLDALYKFSGYQGGLGSHSTKGPFHWISLFDRTSGANEYLQFRREEGMGYGLQEEKKDFNVDRMYLNMCRVSLFSGISDGSFVKYVLGKNSLGVDLIVAQGENSLLLREIYLTLQLLKEGGTLVILVGDIVSILDAQLIFLLAGSFESLSFIKPVTISPLIRERYLIAEGRRGSEITDKVLALLEQALGQKVTSLLSSELPEDFAGWLQEQTRISIEGQLTAIALAVRLLKGDKTALEGQPQYNLRKALVIWGLPDTPSEGTKALTPSFPSSLDIEYRQLTITQKVQRLVASWAEGDPKRKYEADNIIERWLISMVNVRDEEERKDFIDPCSPVYRVTSEKDSFNLKMGEELVTKRLAKDEEDGGKKTQEILKLVSNLLQTPWKLQSKLQKRAECTGRFLIYDKPDIFQSPITPRSLALINKYTCPPVLRAALRYTTMISGGQHWGLTQAHFDILYTQFGFRNEGFASPFNSRFAGKPEGRFGSLFFDTDGIFGSLGDFFSLDFLSHPGGWQINPPFVEELINRMAEKVLKGLEEAKNQNLPLTFIILLPAWRDNSGYLAFSKSSFYRLETHLRKGRYQFELPDSTVMAAPVDTLYLLLTSQPLSPPEHRSYQQMMEGLLR